MSDKSVIDLEHIRKWILLNEDVLKINRIEVKASIPKGSLHHFLKGRRGLNERHIDNLITIISNLGYDPGSIITSQ